MAFHGTNFNNVFKLAMESITSKIKSSNQNISKVSVQDGILSWLCFESHSAILVTIGKQPALACRYILPSFPKPSKDKY